MRFFYTFIYATISKIMPNTASPLKVNMELSQDFASNIKQINQIPFPLKSSQTRSFSDHFRGG